MHEDEFGILFCGYEIDFLYFIKLSTYGLNQLLLIKEEIE